MKQKRIRFPQRRRFARVDKRLDQLEAEIDLVKSFLRLITIPDAAMEQLRKEAPELADSLEDIEQ